MKPAPTMKDGIDSLTGALVNLCAKVAALDKSNIPEYLRAFKEISGYATRLEELSKTIALVEAELSTKTLPEIFKNAQVDSLKTGGSLFTLNVRMFASIPQDKEEKGFAWLRDNKFESLIRPKVNAQSLSAAVKGFFEAEAKLPPDDAVSIHNKEYISIRKA